jgi:hypothetical protein
MFAKAMVLTLAGIALSLVIYAFVIRLVYWGSFLKERWCRLNPSAGRHIPVLSFLQEKFSRPRVNYGWIMFPLLLVLFAPLCLLAADAPTPVGEALGAFLTNTVLPVLGSLVAALVSLILLAIRKKTGIQAGAEYDAWLAKQAETAVQMVAEKAAAAVKLDQMKFTSSEKLEMAIAALVSKAPKLTEEQADQYVHAALARIPGLGATADAAFVPAAG